MRNTVRVEVLLWLALAALPAGALLAVAGAAVAVATSPRLPSAALSVLVAGLLIGWVVTTYQGGVRADETGTGGDVFATAGWVGAAVVVGVSAAAISIRRRRSSRLVA